MFRSDRWSSCTCLAVSVSDHRFLHWIYGGKFFPTQTLFKQLDIQGCVQMTSLIAKLRTGSDSKPEILSIPVLYGIEMQQTLEITGWSRTKVGPIIVHPSPWEQKEKYAAVCMNLKCILYTIHHDKHHFAIFNTTLPILSSMSAKLPNPYRTVRDIVT